MRRVSLQPSFVLFRQKVNRTLYVLFKNRHAEFLQMIDDQTPAFWVGFTITLQEVLAADHRIVLLYRSNTNYTNRFFIFLHDLLIEKRPERITTYINDVVAMARYSKFMNCIDTTLPEFHNLFTEIDGIASFERLFGDKKDSEAQIKVYCTHSLHLYAVGGLLAVFRLWLVAEKSNNLDWVTPYVWSVQKSLLPFYAHLKKRWGKSLLSMLSILIPVAWWDSNFVEYNNGFSCNEVNIFYSLLVVHDLRKKMVMFFYAKPSNMNFTYVSWEVCLRHIHTAEDILFHPYAQLPACVHSELIALELLPRDGFNIFHHKQNPVQHKFSNWCFHHMNLHVELRKAIILDAKFHDSVARETKWTSPETLARLLWNMPLCISWLECVLMQTTRFESAFLPYCHFPVRKRIASVLKRMHTTLSLEPRLLAKAAIIVAEKIWMVEKNGTAICRNSRARLKFCLERLTPKMKYFDNGSCYKLLKFVVKEGWTSEEQLRGQIDEGARERDFISLHNGSAADINIDLCFSDNYRSASYWFNFGGIQKFDFTEQQYSEAMKKIAAYEKMLKSPPDSDNENRGGFLKYDKLYYQKFSKAPGKAEAYIPNLVITDVMERSNFAFSCGFIQDSVCSIFQDAVLSNQLELSVPDRAFQFPGIEFLQLVNPLFDVRTLYTHMTDSQDTLGILHLMEWIAVAMDTNARLCSALNTFNPHLPCPVVNFFELTRLFISKFQKDAADIPNLKQANVLLDELTSPGVIVYEAQCKEPKEIKDLSKLDDPVKELELKRLELLQTVSWVQYQNEMCQSEKQDRYPQFSILECRFVEELAALYKLRELGHQEAMQRLAQLLSFRMNKMVRGYRQWQAGRKERKLPCSEVSHDHMSLLLSACDLNSKVIAILLQLRSVFSAYLSPLLTTHPVSETSGCLLLRLVNMLMLGCKLCDFIGSLVNLYTVVASFGLAYLEQLLDDCVEVWSVPGFYADPSHIPGDVFKHAELVHVAFTHLLVAMSANLYLEYNFSQNRVVLDAFANLVKAGTSIRVGEMHSRTDVLVNIATCYRAVYDTLEPKIFFLHMHKMFSVGWRGYSDEWMLSLKLVEHSLAPFLERIKFKEFLQKASEVSKQPGVNAKSDGGMKAILNLQKLTINCENKSGGHVTSSTDEGNTQFNVAINTNSVKQENTRIKNSGSSSTVTCRKKKNSKEGVKGSGDKLFTKNNITSGKTASSEIAKHVQNNLNCCFGCQKLEQNSAKLIKCEECTSDKWTIVRVYCSSDCRVADWERRHGAEHHVGECESYYMAYELGID